MIQINKDNVCSLFYPFEWKVYRKTKTISAVRVKGPFTTETREGTLMCKDGYVALDSGDNPYPIAKDEFENIYEEV